MDRETFELLEKADWEAIGKDLLAFAERRAWRYTWRHGGCQNLASGQTAEDIVQDVVEKALKGVRKWDPGRGELVPWLKDQVRSLIDHLCWSEAHRYERPVPESDTEGEWSDQIEYAASKASSPSMELANPIQIILRKEEVADRETVLFQAADGDPELEGVVEVLMNGCDPKAREIANELGVPVEDVYNRLRRLRRRISKLREGGES